MPSRVVLVGIGADGWAGVPARLRAVLADADVLVGGDAVLAGVPTSFAQARERWPSPLREGLADLLRRHAGWSVVGVTGPDPLGTPPGRALVDLLGPALHVEPGVSPLALAGARLGWPADLLDVVDLQGRDPHVLARELAPGRRLLLVPGDSPVSAVVDLLVGHAYGASRVVALGGLGTIAETRVESSADTWAAVEAPVDVLALELAGPLVSPWLAGLPDASYEGQVLPRDVRAGALARLAPQPGQLLWDLGSGGGCVAVEWLRAHRSCRALAVERDDERAAESRRNAVRLGTPRLEVVLGPVSQVLADRPGPDAVFIGGFVGGSHARTAVLDACLAALRPGGRLVVHAVTLETEAALGARYAELGGELTRVAVDRAVWTGSEAGWSSRPPVTQWAWQRPS